MKNLFPMGILGLTVGIFLSLASFSFSFEIMPQDNSQTAATPEEDSGAEVHSASEEEAASLPNVGNKICPVSGDHVAEMGGSVPVVYKGKIYNLCCPMCIRDFQKHAEKFSSIAENEVEKDKGSETP